MTDAGGKFRIITMARESNGSQVKTEIDLGQIQSISDTFSATITSQGIPSQPCENAFVFDSGVIESYSIKYARPAPRNPIDSYSVDSTNWSNGFWLYNMLKYVVNRWQAKTDGVRTYYIPSNDSQGLYNGWGYIATSTGGIVADGLNCYVTEFEPNYNVGVPNVISGHISFVIGGLHLSRILKSSVVYRANFQNIPNLTQSQADALADDTSNVVRESNETQLPVIPYPPAWITYLLSKGVELDSRTVRWCESATGTPEIVKKPGMGDVIVQGGTLVLYARYGFPIE